MVICLFMAIWCSNASIFDLNPHPHDKLKHSTKVYCLQCAQLLVLLTFRRVDAYFWRFGWLIGTVNTRKVF